MRFCPRAIAKNGDFYYQLSRFSILSRLLFRYVVKTVSDTVEKTSGTFRRRQIAQQRLLRPRSESYAEQAAFFARAASRTSVGPPSSSAQRVVRRSGHLLRPRGDIVKFGDLGSLAPSFFEALRHHGKLTLLRKIIGKALFFIDSLIIFVEKRYYLTRPIFKSVSYESN